jgi:L-iditol 2-dehydrogenase
MKAAYLVKPNHIEIRNVEKPEPSYGEVRVKIGKVGICGSDVHLFLGHRPLNYPVIIGHEGIGIIDKIGDGVNHRTLGERVAIEPNIPCQQCNYCLSGRGNICIKKRVPGVNESGCFAEYICLPEAFCWQLPQEISDDDAVAIEPMAVAYHSLFSSQAKVGDTIAIIGLGAIGLLLSHLALSLGYKVLVTELNVNKLQIAAGMGAVPAVVSGSADDQVRQLSRLWLDHDVSAIFECAGSAFTVSLATGAAPRGSDVVLVGLSADEATFVPLKIAREGINIVPSIIYDHPFDYRRVIQLIKARIIRPGLIISKNMPLDEIQSAIQLASAGNESKIVIHTNGD